MSKPPSVPHTCPAIDRLKRYLDKHLPGEAQVHARWLLEQVREQNKALRARAAWYEEHERRGAIYIHEIEEE